MYSDLEQAVIDDINNNKSLMEAYLGFKKDVTLAKPIFQKMLYEAYWRKRLN